MLQQASQPMRQPKREMISLKDVAKMEVTDDGQYIVCRDIDGQVAVYKHNPQQQAVLFMKGRKQFSPNGIKVVQDAKNEENLMLIAGYQTGDMAMKCKS